METDGLRPVKSLLGDPSESLEDAYRHLALDLYEHGMNMFAVIMFDAEFNATDIREVSDTMIRARRMLGIPDRVEVKDGSGKSPFRRD